MRKLIHRLLSGAMARASASWDDGPESSGLMQLDIEHYYLRVINEAMRRMMVPDDSFEVGVRPVGAGPGGLDAFAGYIRIVRWDALATPVLLQNMPIIDQRVRKVVNASVLLEHTHFAGLWFQAGSAAHGSPTALLGFPVEVVHQARGVRTS